MEFKADDDASMFDFATGGTATLTTGKDNTVKFTFPTWYGGADGAEKAGDEGPWMGICKHGTRDLIGEMWYRCKTDRAGGFAWAADYIPPPGQYTAIMVPKGGSTNASHGTLELTVKDAGDEAADSEGEAQEGGGSGMFPPLLVSSLPVLHHIHFIFPILMTPLLRPSYSFLLNSYSSPLHTFPPSPLLPFPDDAGQDRKAVFAAAVAAAAKAYMLGEGIDVYTANSEAINTTTEICIGVLKDATKDAGGEAADDSEGKAQEGEGKYDYESSLWSKYDYEARKYDYEKRPCASGGPHSWKQYDYASPCGECGGAITMWCKSSYECCGNCCGGPGMFPPLPVSSLPVLFHIHFIFRAPDPHNFITHNRRRRGKYNP